MVSIYGEIEKALQAGETVALATVINVRGSAPRKVGAKMLIRPDGSILSSIGGGALEATVIEAAKEAIKTGQPRLVHYGLRADQHKGHLGVCGGDVDVFIDVIKPQPTLLLVGGGHVGRYLAEMAHLLGFRILVVDDREDFASPDRFPHAEKILLGEIESRLEEVPISPDTYVVIATRSHEQDALALERVINSPAAYIGLLGSRRKVALIFKALREKGVSEERLAEVHAPIGLDIGAETPEEIAVSILAEMVLLRRGGTGKPLSAIVREGQQ